MDYLFIFGAQYLFIASFVIAAVYFFRQPRNIQKNIIILALIALPLTYLVGKLGNGLYNNPRPFVVGHFTPLTPHAPDNGFPSDHLLLVSAIAAVMYTFHKKTGAILWIIAALVAISRVYVGVHHPLDVIASMLIAAAVTFFVHLFLKKRFVTFL